MKSLSELKQIDIVSWLASKGYEKKKETSSKVWFSSVLRQESNPSFCVYRGQNKFQDFGTCLPKGDIIDLVQAIEGCDMKTAMEILSDDKQVKQYEPIETGSEPLLVVSAVHDSFLSPQLITYLRSRNIPKNVYQKFCKECFYHFTKNPEKTYHAVGFQNVSGGWELRNGIPHKFATSPKDYSFFDGGGHTLNLYEGFFDMMSGEAYFCGHVGDVIVLNGLGLLYRVLPILDQYEKINIFMDNDNAANNALNMIIAKVGCDKVFDYRCIFAPHKDFNEWWINFYKK